MTLLQSTFDAGDGFFFKLLYWLLRFHIIQSNSIPFLVSPYLPTPSLFHPSTKEKKTKSPSKSTKARTKDLINWNRTKTTPETEKSLLLLSWLSITYSSILMALEASVCHTVSAGLATVRLVMFNSTCFEARLPRFTGPVALFGGWVFDSQHPHAAHNHLWLQSQASSTFFWPHWAPGLHVVHRHRCRQNLQKSFFPPHRLRMRMEWIIVWKSGEPAWSVLCLLIK